MGVTAVADCLAARQSICLYSEFPRESSAEVAAVTWWMKYPYFTDMSVKVLHFITSVLYTSMKYFNGTSIKSQESIYGLSSVQFIHWGMSDCLQTHGLQHPRPPLSITNSPRDYSNSCRLSQWHHPSISSSVIHFSSHLQSFPASGSFQMSQFFESASQSIGIPASASVLPMNVQDWFPLGWTGWISLQSKGLSRVFSNTTVQKHQFFSAQLSLYSDSHIHTRLLEKQKLWLDRPLLAK